MVEQLKNFELILRQNRLQIMGLRRERDNFEKRYMEMCEIHKQYQVRESINYSKIQDALNVAETAINEKNAALEREKEIRGKFNADLFTEYFI